MAVPNVDSPNMQAGSHSPDVLRMCAHMLHSASPHLGGHVLQHHDPS